MSNQDQINQAIQIIEAQLAVLKQAAGQSSTEDTPGIVGIFDGEYMVTEEGKRYQLPPNYASKSMLVPGDTVKMVEDPAGGLAKFKQTVKAERLKTTGLLARKDGKFEVLSEEGSFKVLSAAIKHYEGEPGDSVTIQYPKQHVKGSYAAVEKVVKASGAPTSPAASQAEVPQPAVVQATVGPVEQLAATSAEAVPAPSPVIKETVVEQPASAPATVVAAEPVAAAPAPEKAPAPVAPQPAPIQPAAPAALKHTDKTAPEAKPVARSQEGAIPSGNAGARNQSKSSNNDRPKPQPKADQPRAGTSRPSSAPRSFSQPASTSRPVAPAPRPAPIQSGPATTPQPAPAAQQITPGSTGEIPVASVMEEDDLV